VTASDIAATLKAVRTRPTNSTNPLRARQVLQDAGLETNGDLRRAPSALNEVWLAGPYALRISTTPGASRLQHEAAVARSLPPGIPYPEIVAVGRATFGEWMVTKRLPGEVLSRPWATMRPDDRRRAVHEVGRILRALHQVRPPLTPPGRAAANALEAPPYLADDSLECPHQLPVSRVVELLQRAATLPHVDPGLMAAAVERAEAAASAFEERRHGLVHGDLHFENVLWDGTEITALLDLEWARPAPPDLDLDVFLRFCADPDLHVGADYEHLARRADYRDVPGWLRESYPELFAHPRLMDRLVVYGLAYDVRHLLLDPPDGPVSEMHPHHPHSRIRKLVENRSHLSWMQW
jgi:hygromycin-B 7''-O-kinase